MNNIERPVTEEQKTESIVKSTTGDSVNFIKRERHGFTSFCLVLLILINVFLILFMIFSPELFYDYGVDLIVFFSIVAITKIIGLILLLCWKKFGFVFLIIISTISFFIILAYDMIYYEQFLFDIVGIIVLCGVLQIRKNGKSTWKQLE